MQKPASPPEVGKTTASVIAVAAAAADPGVVTARYVKLRVQEEG